MRACTEYHRGHTECEVPLGHSGGGDQVATTKKVKYGKQGNGSSKTSML